jgi:hypothetical protein
VEDKKGALSDGLVIGASRIKLNQHLFALRCTAPSHRTVLHCIPPRCHSLSEAVGKSSLPLPGTVQVGSALSTSVMLGGSTTRGTPLKLRPLPV